ncbi:MAG: Uma2 family endonuclease [Spirochaetota bacterium]
MKAARENKFFYIIRFPIEYANTPKRLDEIRDKNNGLDILFHNSSTIRIAITATLEEYGHLSVKLPGWNETYFESLRLLNPDITFEYANTEEIYIKMGIFAIIGIFTAFVTASLVNWVRKNKLGKPYSDPTEYELDVEPGKKRQKRIPDFSFISFAKVPQNVQKTWKQRIPVSPSLAVEIVSTKKGLQKDLNKMQSVWIPSGVELGLVLCPYSEKIYIFEQNQNDYQTQSIYQDFSHPSLPGYKENFGEILQECRE